MGQVSDDDRAVGDAADEDFANVDALIAAINERHAALHVPRRVRIRRAITRRRLVIALVVLAVGTLAWIWAPVLATVYSVAVLLCVASVVIARPGPEIAVHGLGQSRNRVQPNMDEARGLSLPRRVL